MPNQNLIKTFIDSGDNKRKFGEFESTDFVSVSQGGTGATNAADARTNLGAAASSEIVTDHGDLSGLTDDDHTQYHTDARGDVRYYQQGQINTLLNTKADLIGGVVPSSQLPAFVDDVLEFADLASFPVTGESGKIYIAIDTNKQYRWSGSVYVDLTQSSGSSLPFSYTDSVISPLGTQSNSFQTYSSNTFSVTDSGDYEIIFSFLWSLNTTGSDFILEITLDGVALPETQIQVEPKDSGGGSVTISEIGGGSFNSGTNQKIPNSVEAVRNLSVGSHTILVRMRCEVTGTEAAIHASTLKVKRLT